MQLKHYSILISVLGIIVLYFISTLSQPPLIEIKQLPKYENRKVKIKGMIVDIQNTKYQSQIIKIKNENETLKLYVEGKKNVEYGDIIEATGNVQKYEGEWEVTVNNEKNIKTIRKWTNITIPISQIAKKPTTYEGVNIKVEGTVDLVYDTYFFLTDNEEQHSIVVLYNQSKYRSLSTGKRVKVAGELNFDPKTFRYMLSTKGENHYIKTLSEG